MGRTLPRWLLLSIGIIAVSIFAVACGGDDDEGDATGSTGSTGSAATGGGGGSSGEEVTVGFIYVGTVDDGGYNQAAYQGELAVAEMNNVKTIHAENVPEVGSSRVDLQACKLEYSIVSPK